MNSYRKIILSSILTPVFFIAFAQTETSCTNGIDDDGDGLVDCFDPDCAANNSCDDFFFGNSVVCFEDVDVQSFAIRQQWGSENTSATSHASPAVGDLDGNGIPEVIAVNNYGDRIVILNGQTGATEFSASVGFDPENTPAIANVDMDETAEILVTQNEGRRMRLFSHELQEEWFAQASRNDMGIAGFADFNEDNIAEIYYKNEIRNAVDGTLLIEGDGDWERDYVHGPIAIDIYLPGDPDCIAAGGDCSGLELITGNQIWAVNITNTSGTAGNSMVVVKDMNDALDASGIAGDYYPKYWGGWLDGNRSTVSVADYNLDGNMDVLLSGALGNSGTSQTTIFFWDVTNEAVTIFQAENFIRGPGRINIADVDDDGQPNANFVMNQRLYSLDENFNVHWIHPIAEGSSGFTGCTLFDFDGDGTVETVYRSEQSVLILDGVGNGDQTTFVRNELPCVSRTQEEYPIVADVDGDGASEICVACYFNDATNFNPYSNTQFAQIRLFESNGEAWMPARSVWNQHGYFNVNINDDLTVPAEIQDHTVVFSTGICEYSDGTLIPYPARPLNTFLTQSPILDENGCVEFVSPDIVVLDNPTAFASSTPVCPGAETEVTFYLLNDGDTDISGILPVSFYSGDPTVATSTYLDTELVSLTAFDEGDTVEVVTTFTGQGGDYQLYIVANDFGSAPPIAASLDDLPNSSIPECNTDNNYTVLNIVSQSFALTVEKLEDDRRCDLNLTPNGSARAVYFGLTPEEQTTIWLENFEDLSNNDRTDAGATPWTATTDSNPSNWGVADFNNSKMFRARRTGTRDGVGVVTWVTDSIDISQFRDIEVTIDMFESGNQEGQPNVWYDFIEVTYQSFDQNDILLSSGQFPINGYVDDDFTYAQASLSGLKPSSNDPDSVIIITVTIHNTAGSENHYIDNINVTGLGGGTILEQTEADGFVFEWYDASDNLVHTGSTYSQMAAGSYRVTGYLPSNGCQGDTVSVDILNINATSTPPYVVNTWIYEISPLDDCALANGSLGAFVYTETQDGTFPATVANPPQDTLLAADGYSFAWRITNDATNTTIGTGETIGNLTNQSYTVDILESFSGCVGSAALTVSSGLSFPPDPTVVVTNITSCGGSGELSASVGGNTADYTFEWFDGPGVKPVPDFTGPIYTVFSEGDYTVRAIQNSSSCPSNAVTETVLDASSAPVASVSLVQDNSSCVSGNGIVSADGDGAGTVLGFTFDWFKGANTLPANALPGAAEPNSFLVSDNPFELGGLTEGMYRVVVTEDATSCSDTLDVFVTDVPTVFTVTPGDLVINSINSCNLTVLGSIDASQIVPGNVNDVSIGNINTSFEDFDIRTATNFVQDFGGSIRTFNQEDVPGWSTTATDQRIEIWHNDNTQDGGIHKAFHGEQFAEINANETAALYFDLSTNPGAILSWTFAHKGRAGTDEISVNIGAPGSEVVQNTFSTGNTAWAVYNGDYTIPASQTITRFQFEAVSTAAGNTSVGNFVDTITFVLYPYRFELYEGTVASGTPDYINTDGQFSDLDDGNYVLIVYDNLTGCNATEVPITINRDTSEPVIAATLTGDSNCDTGVGIIDVTASTATEPASYTFQIFDGHSFATQIGSDISVADGSIGNSYQNLEPGDYRVNIINDDTECNDFADLVVDDITASPTLSPITIVNDNTSCDPANPNGFAGVSVDGEQSSDYLFYWYDGPDTTATPIVIAGDGQDNISSGVHLVDAGFYTVFAENKVSGCETQILTLQVSDDPYVPTIVIEEIDQQTDCGTGNGSLRAYVTNDPIGLFPPGSQLTEAEGFSFRWQLDGVDLVDATPAANGSVPSGVATSTVSGLIADEYTVIVTYDDFACSNTSNFTLTEDQIFPSISLDTSTPNTTCDPAAYTGSITVQIEFDGVNPVPDLTGYSFTWYNGSGASRTLNASSTTATLSGLNQGDYSVEVQAPNSCSSTIEVFSIVDALPVVAGGAGAVTNNTVCAPDGAGGNPDFNGAIAFTPTTDAVPAAAYTFALRTSGGSAIAEDGSTGGIYADVAYTATGANTSSVTGLPAGNYIMNVSDNANTCNIDVPFAVADDFTDIPVIGAVATTPNTTCDPTAYTGTADASGIVSGGSGSYSYFWATAADPGTLIDDDAILDDDINTNTGVVEGDYILIVTDALWGCVSATESVTISPNLPIVAGGAGAVTNNTVCAPDGAGGNPDYNGAIAFTPTTDAVPGGTYTYALRTSGGTPVLAAGGSGGIYTDVDYATSGAGSSVSGLPAGNYIMNVSDNANTCNIDVPFAVADDFTDIPVIGAVATTPNTTCDPTAYTGTADASGIVSGGSGSYSYFWATAADPGTLIDDDAILDDDINTNTGVVEGDYILIVTDALWGCVSATESVTISPNLPIVAGGAGAVTNNTVCAPDGAGGNPDYNGAIAFTPTTDAVPGGTYTYALRTSGGTPVLAAGGSGGIYTDVDYATSGAGSSVSGLPAGNYIMNVSDNANTCNIDVPFAVADDFTDIPVIGAVATTPNTTCDPTAYTGTADASGIVSGGSGSYSYFWATAADPGTLIDDDAILDDDINTNTGVVEGDYILIVTDALWGCVSATESVTISPNLPIVAGGAGAVTNNTVCAPDGAGGNPDYNGAIAFTPTTDAVPGGTYTYALRTSGGTPVLAAGGSGGIYTDVDYATSGAGSSVSGLPAGNYIMNVSDNANTCNIDVPFAVADDFTDIPVIGAVATTPNTTCDPTAYTGTADASGIVSGGSGSYSYFWATAADPGTLIDDDAILDDDINTNTGVVEGDYILIVTDALWGCVSATESVTISPNLPIVAGGAGAVTNNTVCAPDGAGGNPDYNGAIAFTPTTDAVPGGTYTYALRTSGGTPVLAAGGSGGIYTDVDYATSGAGSSVSGLPAGNYIMNVSDNANTCNIDVPFAVADDFTDIPVIGAVATTPNTTCDPTAYTGTADASGIVSGGSGSYSYFWATAADPGTLIDDDAILDDDINTNTGVVEGDYILIVTDALWGCVSATESVTISPNLPIVAGGAGAVTNNTVCAPDGAGGNPDYNGAIAFTPTTDAVPGGTYTYALRTSGGTPVLAAGGSGGIYTDVDYATSGAGSSVSGLPAGNYIMNVSDNANTCNIDVPFAVADDFTDIPVINQVTLQAATVDNTTCDPTAYTGLADASTHVSGGSGSYTFSWATAADPGTEIDDDAILDDDINTNTGVVEGDYILTVTDALWGCVSVSVDITIGATLPPITPTTVVLQDNFSCSPASPIGSATLTLAEGPNTAYSFEWYVGTSIAGVPFDTDDQIDNQLHGTYTVLIQDDATLCTTTAQVVIGEFTPSLSVSSTSSVDHSDCYPANGEVTVTPSLTFVPAGPPTGLSSTFTYQWYFGTSATPGNELAEGVDPGNLSTPTNVATNNVSGLAAGDYTVVITETQTGCISAIETVTVVDDVSPAKPTVSFNADVIPSSCAGENGRITATITALGTPTAIPGSGTSFSFEWYEGAQDYASLELTGSAAALVTGDALNANPSPPGLTVIVSTAGGTGVGANTTLDQLVSGLYTLVTIDNVTGCRYFDIFDLGFLGQQITTTLTIDNVTSCPDNGIARVGLADNVELTISAASGTFITGEPFTTDGGAFGTISADGGGDLQVSIADGSPTLSASTTVGVTIITGTTSGETAVIDAVLFENYSTGLDHPDDITQYEIFLYAGSGVPADRFAAYTFDGRVFPYVYYPTTGVIEDGNGTPLASSPGAILTPGDQAEFPELPAGDYVALAREIPNPAFNPGSTAQCWTVASADEQILDLAFEPIIQSSSITDNTNCDITNGNGQLSVTIIEDPTENTNPVPSQQPNGYRFTWEDATSTVILAEDILTETATSTTAADLEPGNYTVTIQRLGGAGNTPNGCEVSTTLTIGNNPEQHQISAATITDNNDCNPLDGAIVITDAQITDNAADYRYTWYTTYISDGNAGNVLLGDAFVDGGLNNGDLGANSVSGLVGGTYYVEAVQDVKTCETPVFEVEVQDLRTNPIVQLTSSLPDESCDGETPTGSATVNVIVGGVPQAVGDYVFNWFASDGTTQLVSVPYDNLAVSTFQDGETVTIGAETALVVSDNGTNLVLSGLSGTISDNDAITGGTSGATAQVNNAQDFTTTGSIGANVFNGVNDGTYFAIVTDNVTPDLGCFIATPVEVTVGQFDPTYSIGTVAATDFNITHVDDCNPVNGGYQILRITETQRDGTTTTATPLTDFTFTWYDDPGLAPANLIADANIVGFNNGDAGAAQVSGLDAGTYYVDIASVSTGCPSTGNQVHVFTLDDNKVNPVVQVSTILDDESCDGAAPTGSATVTVFVGGTAQLATAYVFNWFASDGTTQLVSVPYDNLAVSTFQDGETVTIGAETALVVSDNGTNLVLSGLSGTISDDNVITGGTSGATAQVNNAQDFTTTGSIGANVFNGANNGTYFVVATDNSSPSLGCANNPAVQVDIDQFDPTYSIGTVAATDFNITHVDDCNPVNGGYQILRITETQRDGTTTTATPLTDFTFTWYDDPGLAPANLIADANIVGFNNGDAGAAQVSGLDAGTYYVDIASVSTGCPSTGNQVHVFTLDDNKVNPVVQVSTILDDESCDGAAPTGSATVTVFVGGTAQLATAYVFNWFASDGTTQLVSVPYDNLAVSTFQDGETVTIGAETALVVSDNGTNLVLSGLSGTISDDNVITGGTSGATAQVNNAQDFTTTGSIGANVFNGANNGTYFVVATDNSSPSLGCANNPAVQVDIDQFDPTYSIGTVAATDFNITHVDDCNPVNGGYQILRITETQRDGTTTTATPLTDFTFTWYDDPGLAPANLIADANIVGFNNGDAGAAQVSGLDAGTYYVDIASVSTGCPSTGNQVHVFTLDDNKVNPVVQVSTILDDESCDGAAPTGSATVTVFVGGTAQLATAYVFNWFASDGTTQLVSVPYDNLAVSTFQDGETVTIGAETALVVSDNGTNLVLSGLSGTISDDNVITGGTSGATAQVNNAQDFTTTGSIGANVFNGANNGTYFVVATDNSSPSLGCANNPAVQVDIDQFDPTYSIGTVAATDFNITHVDDCNPVNGGYQILRITETQRDGTTTTATPLTDFTFTWYDDPGLAPANLIADANIVGFNNGDAGAAQVSGLDAGTYYVDIASVSTGCPSTGNQVHVFTLDDNKVNPVVQVSTILDDESCDGAAPTGSATVTVFVGGTAQLATAYVFNWFASDGTTQLVSVPYDNLAVSTFQDGETVTIGAETALVVSDNGTNLVLSGLSGTISDDNVITGGTSGATAQVNNAQDFTTTGSIGANVFNGANNGTYFVVATDNSSPSLGCANNPAVQVDIDQFDPTYSIGTVAATDFNITHVDDCNPVNGGYQILRITETQRDGTTTTATPLTDFTFTWYDDPGLAPANLIADANIVGFNNGDAGAAQVSGLDAGTYYVDIASVSTGCPSTGNQVHVFTLDDNKVNPVVQVSTILDDESCDGAAPTGSATVTVFVGGTAQLATAYVFNWFASDGTTQLVSVPYDNLAVSTFQDGETVTIGAETALVVSDNGTNLVLSGLSGTISDDNVITGGTSGATAQVNNAQDFTTTGSIGANVFNGANNGTYFVVATDNSSPSLGCANNPAVQVDIDQFDPTYSIGTVAATDFNITHVDDCNPVNGGYQILRITETQRDGTTTTATPLTDFTFTWYDDPGLAPANLIADANIVGFNNGDAGAAQVSGLDAGTYYVDIASVSTGCPSTGNQVHVFTLDDNRGTLVVAKDIANSTDDTYCSATAGDGILEIDIIENGLAALATDFTITWYRGTTVAAANEIWPNDGGTQGTATDISVGADRSRMGGLIDGDYTVTILDNVSPNLGCAQTVTLNVGSMEDIPTIDDIAILARTLPDTICGSGVGNESGTIILDDADLPGVLTDYTIEVRQGNITGTLISNALGTSPQTAFTGLAAADYFLTATNNTTGCSAATAIINVSDSTRNPQISLVGIIPDQSCDGGLTSDEVGGINVAIDGVHDDVLITTAPRFALQWINDATGNNVSVDFPTVTDTEAVLSGVPSGNYTLNVTNIATNCVQSATFVVPIEQVPISISASTVVDNTVCVGTLDGSFTIDFINYGGILIDATTITAGYRMEVHTTPAMSALVPDGNAATPFTWDALATGTYYAFVINELSNCASDGLRFEIEDQTDRPEVLISLVQADSSCVGGTPNGTLSSTADMVTETDPNYTFEWFAGATDTGPVLATTATINGLGAGTYTLRATRTTDGCASVEQFIVPAAPITPEILTANTTPATTCIGNGTIEITSMSTGVLGDYTFAYYTQDPTGTPAPTPIAGFTGTTFTQAQPEVIYYVVATHNVYNCSSIPFQISVGDDTQPIDIQDGGLSLNNTNCNPNAFNGALSINVNGAAPTSPAYDVQWFLGSDTSTVLTEASLGNPGTLAGETTATVSGIPGGTYTVRVRDNATGCVGLYTDDIIDTPRTVILRTSTQPNTSCIAPNGELSVSVVEPFPTGLNAQSFDYYWFDGDITNPDTTLANYTGVVVQNLPAGMYTVAVVERTDRFCQYTDVVQIQDGIQPPVYELAKTDVTVCFDVKNGFAEVTLPDVSIVNIEWLDMNGNLITTLNQTFVDSLDVGTYQLRLTDVNTGCTSGEFFNIDNIVVPLDAPNVTVNGARTSCTDLDGWARADVNGEVNGYAFEWYDVNDLVTPFATGDQVFALDSGEYLVRAIDLSTGCESPFSTATVGYESIVPVFELSVSVSTCLRTEDGSVNQFDTEVSVIIDPETNPIPENPSYDPLSPASGNYEWRNASGNVVGTDPKLIDVAPGSYTVSFTTRNGCTYSSSFEVTTDIQVYNGLSPNGDGLNDFLLIDCIDYFGSNKVEIFARDGVKVFETDNYDNVRNRFEGFSNMGNSQLELPAGTYFAVINLNDGREPFNIYIELVR